MSHFILLLNSLKKSGKVNDMKLYLFVIILLFSLRSNGDTVKFSAIVLDDITGNPLANVSVGAGFTMDAGPGWENRFKYIHKEFLSDADGVCNDFRRTSSALRLAV